MRCQCYFMIVFMFMLLCSFCGCGTVERNTQKVAYEEVDLGKKLPMTARVVFAPRVDKLRASVGYQMKVSVNNEKQNEQLGVAMGTGFKESVLSALRKRFAEVIDESSAVTSGGTATFNPYNTTCIIELDPESPKITGQGAAAGFNSQTQGGYFLTMKTRMSVKAVTGEIFSDGVINSKGVGKLNGNAAFVGGMTSALTLGLAADASAGQQLVNGTEDLIAEMIRTMLWNLKSDFAEDFTEFTMYSAAMKSKSVTDMKAFLEKYPKGKRARKMTEALDTQMYEFAQSSNMPESYMEYLEKMPAGKYRSQVKSRVEPLMYAEIAKGNLFFCGKYKELLPEGDHIGDVGKQCR